MSANPNDARGIIWSCSSKQRFASEDVAKKVAIKCFEARGTDLRVYHCEICLGFHLTSKDADRMMRPGWRPPAVAERFRRDRDKEIDAEIRPDRRRNKGRDGRRPNRRRMKDY